MESTFILSFAPVNFIHRSQSCKVVVCLLPMFCSGEMVVSIERRSDGAQEERSRCMCRQMRSDVCGEGEWTTSSTLASKRDYCCKVRFLLASTRSHSTKRYNGCPSQEARPDRAGLLRSTRLNRKPSTNHVLPGHGCARTAASATSSSAPYCHDQTHLCRQRFAILLGHSLCPKTRSSRWP
jgi:hypothetical protein